MLTIREYSLKYRHNSRIVCPHCDYVDEDLCDYPEELNEDYATTTMTCGNCEQEFKVSMTISYSYSTEKLKEDNP